MKRPIVRSIYYTTSSYKKRQRLEIERSIDEEINKIMFKNLFELHCSMQAYCCVSMSLYAADSGHVQVHHCFNRDSRSRFLSVCPCWLQKRKWHSLSLFSFAPLLFALSAASPFHSCPHVFIDMITFLSPISIVYLSFDDEGYGGCLRGSKRWKGN